MTSAVLVQCRLSSQRLPEKILKKINSKTIIEILIERLKKVDCDKVILVIANENNKEKLVKIAKKNKIDFFLGSKKNVLKRYYLAAKKFKIKNIVRVTSDCPLIDPKLINQGIKVYKKKKLDYLSNNLKISWPHGLDYEVFNFKALKLAHFKSSNSYEKEHVTPYIKRSNRLKKFNIENKKINLDKYYRWTLDTQIDYDFLKALFKKNKRILKKFDWLYLLSFLKKNPVIQTINTKNQVFN